MFRTMDPPVVKKVNLCRLWHRGGLKKNARVCEVVEELQIPTLPVFIILGFKVANRI
jgi:hypothetical protein